MHTCAFYYVNDMRYPIQHIFHLIFKYLLIKHRIFCLLTLMVSRCTLFYCFYQSVYFDVQFTPWKGSRWQSSLRTHHILLFRCCAGEG